MAYCTVADVQKLFANIVFGGNTPVTTTDIETVHIPTADALIDARLRRFISLPVTSSADRELLRLISMNLAAGSIAEVLYETSAQPNDQPGARRHRERGETLLAQIERGTLRLESDRRDPFEMGVFSEPLISLEREF